MKFRDRRWIGFLSLGLLFAGSAFAEGLDCSNFSAAPSARFVYEAAWTSYWEVPETLPVGAPVMASLDCRTTDGLGYDLWYFPQIDGPYPGLYPQSVYGEQTVSFTCPGINGSQYTTGGATFRVIESPPGQAGAIVYQTWVVLNVRCRANRPVINSVTINSNQPPFVGTSAPIFVNFTGGEIKKYAWRIISAPEGSLLTQGSGTSRGNFSITPDVEGDYQIGVAITDVEDRSNEVEYVASFSTGPAQFVLTANPESGASSQDFTFTLNPHGASLAGLKFSWSILDREGKLVCKDCVTAISDEPIQASWRPNCSGDFIARVAIANSQGTFASAQAPFHVNPSLISSANSK